MKVGGVFVVLCGFVTFLLAESQASDAFVYSKMVDEVMQDPGAFEGKRLRVEGDLRQGSVTRRDSPCEWRFVLEKGGQEMRVRFPECVVPDTFRDDMGISVTVQGKLEGEVFVADEVIPKCPSKYEMKERLEQGEASPHAMPKGSEQGPEQQGLGQGAAYGPNAKQAK